MFVGNNFGRHSGEPLRAGISTVLNSRRAMSAAVTANGAASARGGAIAPPHNLDAEQSVLGAILLSDRSLYALVIEEGLRPEDFYRERHGTVYEAMLSL